MNDNFLKWIFKNIVYIVKVWQQLEDNDMEKHLKA